jgi:para-nitrobenzyl esterase
VLIGTNQDEWTVIAAEAFLSQGRMPDYLQSLAAGFGADSGRIAQLYPLNWYGNSAMAYSAVATDGLFACPAYRMETALAKDAKVYAYEFSDRDTPEPERVRDAPFPVGAGHALEVHYLFGPEDRPLLNRAQRKLSDRMIRYWTSFIANGAPRADGAPDWPAVAGAHGPWMSLETPEVRLFRSFDEEHQCAFWDTVETPR